MSNQKHSPQQRRLAQTKQDILQNAHQIVVEQGTAAFSMRQLADKIDYTPGALYKYFPSKEALLDAVRADCFERLNQFIAARVATATTAAVMLLEGGMAYIEYAGQAPQEYHLMFNMEPSEATMGAQRGQAMRMLLYIVQMGLENGEFVVEGGYDAEAIAYHCWATVHGIASLHTAVLWHEREDLLAVSRLILQKVITGFCSPP